MQLERDTATRLIEYLKTHGYPENSIAVEYQIGDRYRVDVAILDLKKNIPIQLFEIKSMKTPEMIRMGTEQVQKYVSYLKNKNIPVYLVFPKDEAPFLEIIKIDPQNLKSLREVSEETSFIPNYIAQRNSRIAEEADIVSKKKEKVIDTFKIICWIVAGITLVIGVLSKLKVIDLDATDLTIIGAVIALILIPFASKLKILGVEFERLTDRDK
jgi:hypothetical protein